MVPSCGSFLSAPLALSLGIYVSAFQRVCPDSCFCEGVYILAEHVTSNPTSSIFFEWR